jgi:uncharacterized iron-regulated membrane protein
VLKAEVQIANMAKKQHSLSRVNRNIHKWLSLLIALPLLVTIFSGILLLTRKEFAFIQPPTSQGVGNVPSISFAQILEQAKTVEQAGISSWDSIDRLDVRPDKGIVKVRAKSSWEIQIDSQSGEIKQVASRRSDIIEKIHDGTFFQSKANLWLMLPVTMALLSLSVTGIILFFRPYYKRRKKRNN